MSVTASLGTVREVYGHTQGYQTMHMPIYMHVAGDEISSSSRVFEFPRKLVNLNFFEKSSPRFSREGSLSRARHLETPFK